MEKYKIPNIIKCVPIKLNGSILQASFITNDVSVETTGQEVVEYDFNKQNTFNHNWE